MYVSISSSFDFNTSLFAESFPFVASKSHVVSLEFRQDKLKLH